MEIENPTIITVLNTPFTADDFIDLPGLRRNVRDAIAAGVSGFLVPAMASEVDYLTSDEKREIVELVVKESDGRALVIGGASSQSQETRLRLTSEFTSLGCDGILVQMDAQTDPNTMLRHLSELAARDPGFLMLQDWDAKGPGISVPVLQRLFEQIPRLEWLKIEVNDAGPKYSQVLACTGGKLRVAGGWAVTEMIDGMTRGVHAFMPTAMHRVYVEICRRYAAGENAAAQELFARIESVLEFSNQSLEVSIHFFKRMLFVQGVYETPNVRIQSDPLSEAQLQQADELIASVTALEAELQRATASTADL